MDLASPLQKQVYAMVDKNFGTEDSMLNAVMKTTLLRDEIADETIEQIEFKMRYNTYIMQQAAENEMNFTIDAAGNIIEINRSQNIDLSGDYIAKNDTSGNIENFIYEPKTSEGSA